MALALKDAGVTSSVWKPTHEALTERRAWDSIGVTSTEDLRALVREVDPMLSKPDPAARIALERKMRISESKIPGFFPTPTRIADRMVTAADVRPGDRVLEPSAGTGRLADAAQAAGATVHVAESSHLLREELTARGHQLVGEDALRISGTYDKILMNPPFENGQDIAHVRHAFEHNLAPGGTLVSVMGEGAFFRERAADREFRDLLDDHGHSEKLPEGTFKEGDHPTGVSTRMVVLHKPG